MDDKINNDMETPKWMKILCQKHPSKGNASDNYWPISCLPLMSKLMNGMKANSLYKYLEMYNLLPIEQKGCQRNSRVGKDQHLMDKTVLNDFKKRQNNLEMTSIDYQKAYDLILHT